MLTNGGDKNLERLMESDITSSNTVQAYINKDNSGIEHCETQDSQANITKQRVKAQCAIGVTVQEQVQSGYVDINILVIHVIRPLARQAVRSIKDKSKPFDDELAVAETEAAVYRSLPHLRASTFEEFAAYIYGTAKNTAYDLLRHSIKHTRSMEYENQAQIEDAPALPENNLWETEILLKRACCRAKLKPLEEELLLRVKLYRQSYVELQKLIGLKPGTISSMVSRAAAKVRPYL